MVGLGGNQGVARQGVSGGAGPGQPAGFGGEQPEFRRLGILGEAPQGGGNRRGCEDLGVGGGGLGEKSELVRLSLREEGNDTSHH